MAPRQLDDLHDVGVDILGTTQAVSGVVLAQTGAVVTEEVSSDNAEMWFPPGYVSRPAKADRGKAACQAITINKGDFDHVIGVRDMRCATIPGTIREGETCIYAPGPSNQGTGRILMQDDGSQSTITMFTNHLLNLGGTGGDAVALAPALQSWATEVNAALAYIKTAFNVSAGGVAAAAVKLDPAIPSVSSLASTVASSKVKAVQ